LSELTPWFPAFAIQDPSDSARLSGCEVRQHLCFATPKGNAGLYRGQTKTALVKALPAV